MKKTTYITTAGIILVAGIIYLISLIFQKVPDTKNLEAIEVFSANSISDKIISQEDFKKFNSFIEKPITISGNIKSINKNNTKYILILNSKNKKIKIVCNMQNDQNEKISTLNVGENVTLKGIYKGYLIDMILLNCIVI